MSSPDYPLELKESLISNPQRTWRTWQGFNPGDAAIDLNTSLVVTIVETNWASLRLIVEFPHGTRSAYDPEELVAVANRCRHEAYKTWCLNLNRLDLWEAFSAVETHLATLPTLALSVDSADEEDHNNIYADCGHMTSEPWRCPVCQELLCLVCRGVHDCVDLED